MFRRTKPKTRPAEVIAAEKAKKMALAKTCQCCGRQIFAETGRIAHHGYQRPGWGIQTASCMGAKELPFEAGREALGRMIGVMKNQLGKLIEHKLAVEAGVEPTPYTYNIRKAGKWVPVTIYLTQENFSEHQETIRRAAYEFSDFFEIKQRYVERQDRAITSLEDDVREQYARYDGWNPTHKFESGEWVAI
jgi:hypothetical protein